MSIQAVVQETRKELKKKDAREIKNEGCKGK